MHYCNCFLFSFGIQPRWLRPFGWLLRNTVIRITLRVFTGCWLLVMKCTRSKNRAWRLLLLAQRKHWWVAIKRSAFPSPVTGTHWPMLIAILSTAVGQTPIQGQLSRWSILGNTLGRSWNLFQKRRSRCIRTRTQHLLRLPYGVLCLQCRKC